MSDPDTTRSPRALVPVTQSRQAKGTPTEPAFAAQVLGGEPRRGLRGGPEALEAAKSTYLETEWSGGADRRAPKGGRASKAV
jgi:hypothetical protein